MISPTEVVTEDEILKEVRRIKESIAAAHDYNVDAIIKSAQSEPMDRERPRIEPPAKSATNCSDKPKS